MCWLFSRLGSLQRGDGWGSLGGAGRVWKGSPHPQRVKSKHHGGGGEDHPRWSRPRRAAWGDCTRKTAWQRWRGELSSGKSKPEQPIDVETVGLMMLCGLPESGWRSLLLRSNVPQSQSRALLAGRGLCQSLFFALLDDLKTGFCGQNLLERKPCVQSDFLPGLWYGTGIQHMYKL